jgi:DNA invertase Pin-like site-specific DNA recombinase
LRVTGYIRTSTRDQTLGLEAQEKVIRQYCDARGWELVGVERDQASGRSTRKRPGFARAQAACRSGLTDGIISARVDRLSRSIVDLGQLLEDAKRHGYEVVAIDLGVDTSSAQGQLIAGVLGSVAQWESAINSERTKAALNVLKSRGARLGNPAFRGVDQDVIERMAFLRASGLSFAAIADRLEAEGYEKPQGGTVWRGSTVSRILRREAARHEREDV